MFRRPHKEWDHIREGEGDRERQRERAREGGREGGTQTNRRLEPEGETRDISAEAKKR